MDYQCLRIPDIGKCVWDFQCINQCKCIFLTSHPQRQDRSISSGKLFFRDLIPIAAFQSRIVDSNRRIRLFQPLCKFQRIAALPFHPQSQCLHPDQIQIRVHRCQTCTCVTEKAVSESCNISHRAKFFVSCNLRIHLGIPLKSSTVSKNTADRIAASVDVFGRRIDHDICTMF